MRQGDAILREVVVFTCQRSVLAQTLAIVEEARLNPVGVDIEPAALIRSYAGQYRRDEDLKTRALMVHIGYSRTAVVIAQGDDLLFVKYIDLGGLHFDQAVARHLKMELPEAVSLRKHNGDRRTELQDPEVARSVGEAIRPVVERLAGELAMCVRYHSVTFRGQPLVRPGAGGRRGHAGAARQPHSAHGPEMRAERPVPLVPDRPQPGPQGTVGCCRRPRAPRAELSP